MLHNHQTAEARLKSLELPLSAPSKPSGNYVPYTMVPPLLYLSGATPKVGGVLKYKGKVGHDLTKDEGYQAARQCAVNQLNTIRSAIGSLDRVTGIVKMTGFIQSAPGFDELPYVLNGASDLLIEVFGELGFHARSAVGAASLPGGAPVEIELIIRYDE